MGEAKRRGTQEERTEQAVERDSKIKLIASTEPQEIRHPNKAVKKMLPYFIFADAMMRNKCFR